MANICSFSMKVKGTKENNMKEFIMTEFFKSPISVSKYITTHKIPKRKILSLVHNGKEYVLFYYTTLKKEDKRDKRN